jgi:N-acetylglutamate synthase-like GNAT family acetyltransferase
MLTIRQARASDCDAICEARQDAILRHCSASHGEQAAHAWADGLTPDGCAQWLRSKMVIVAEEAGNVLACAGFDPATGEIEVAAKEAAEHRAIPAALVAVIEAEARARDLDRLRVLAVPGAEKFFTACGFNVDATQASPAEHAVPSVKLSKRLVYPEPRPERRRNGSSSASVPTS